MIVDFLEVNRKNYCLTFLDCRTPKNVKEGKWGENPWSDNWAEWKVKKAASLLIRKDLPKFGGKKEDGNGSGILDSSSDEDICDVSIHSIPFLFGFC